MPQKSDEEHIVSLSMLKNFDLDKFSFSDAMKIVYMMVETNFMECDTLSIIGLTTITDLEGLQTRHLSQLIPQFIK
jgi:hypothetical protein